MIAKKVDVLGYGGAGGGGKTDLACGLTLNDHTKTAIFRRYGTELTAITDRLIELVGSDKGFNRKDNIWRIPFTQKQIEFGSVPNLGDEKKYKGRPKDLLVLDEADAFLEDQVRYLTGWVRSVKQEQHCLVLMCFNPPSADGRWLVKYFAPWIDRKYLGKRAMPGEIRYFAQLPDEQGVSRDVEVPDATPIYLEGEPLPVLPESRTFIPALVTDNKYLRNTRYVTRLQLLPEPLRSQMLYGDFEAGMEDHEMQVIPTAWVDEAMARWKPRTTRGLMESMGVDVARGGKDKTAIARLHVGEWWDETKVFPGRATPDGPSVAGEVIMVRRHKAPVHIDAVGVGASPHDFLVEMGVQSVGVNVGEKADSTDLSGIMHFDNLRSQLWWKFREYLDPRNDHGPSLPPEPELAAELTAPLWKRLGSTIHVESRDEIIKRIGRSPDRATAYILALIRTPRMKDLESKQGKQAALIQGHNPYADMER